VLLPFRELFEFFELDVSWDDKTKTATARNEEKEIVITVNDTKAYVNGEEKTLDVFATIIDSKTYVPMRFIAESIIKQHLKYLEGFTRNLYISRWI
jgi:hypothetical protein